jgi:hypothetical protein
MLQRLLVLFFLPVLLVAAAKRPPVLSVDPVEVSVSPGNSVESQISITVKSGYHVQANPASESYLIATKLELKPAEGIEPSDPIYPKGQPYKLEGTEKPLSTYAKTFMIKVPLKAAKDATAGPRTVRGTLHYQACDAHTCLFPDTIPVEITVTVTKS